MKKNEKKLTPETKKNLKFLVEDFLEKTPEELSSSKQNPGDVENFWNRFEAILLIDTLGRHEVDPEEKIGTDFKKLILEYHSFLRSVWIQFRDSIFGYKYDVTVAREREAVLTERIKKDPSSDIYPYRELSEQESIIDWEQYYEIKITVSFDPGHVTFYKSSLNVLLNFMDFLKNIPNYYFVRCEHCEKCIVLTRSDKKYCKGCAAKKHQKEKWAKNPEGMKLREKERYHTKRKK